MGSTLVVRVKSRPTEQPSGSRRMRSIASTSMNHRSRLGAPTSDCRIEASDWKHVTGICGPPLEYTGMVVKSQAGCSRKRVFSPSGAAMIEETVSPCGRCKRPTTLTLYKHTPEWVPVEDLYNTYEI